MPSSSLVKVEVRVEVEFKVEVDVGVDVGVEVEVGVAVGGSGLVLGLLFRSGGWLEIGRVKLISTQVVVEFEVEVELGKYSYP